MPMPESSLTRHCTERCSRITDADSPKKFTECEMLSHPVILTPMQAHEHRMIEGRDQPHGGRRGDRPRVALLLVALTLSSCAKDPGPAEVSGANNCESMVVAVPSTAPGRLLVGYTPYGPNWVTPDFSFVRQHSSIISLHTGREQQSPLGHLPRGLQISRDV
jgi:hypothetical protein